VQTSRHVIGRVVSTPLVVLCLTVALTEPSPAMAASNGTWTDLTSGGLWSNGGNWAGSIVADGVDAIADFTTLDISTDDTVHLDSTRTVGQLLFGDTTPSNSWILDNNGNSANALKLFTSVGTPSITVDSGTTATISAALMTNQGFTKSGNGTLALSGPNTYSGGTTISGGILAGTTVSLQGNILDNATLVFDQSLSNLVSGTYSGQISGTGAVTKNGVGTVTLSGTSSYSGVTTISNGNLALGGNVTSGVNGPLGNSAGAILLGDANTPAMANPTLILGGFTISRPITIQNFNAGGDTYFVANVSGGSSLVSGLITLNQPLTIQQAGSGGGISLIGGINGNGNAITFTASGSSSNSINVNSPITGVGTSVTANGIGTVTLSSANTYSGTTTASAGMLELASPTALPGGIGASGGISGLTLAGGVIGLANGDFSRGLGTGASQVQWTGSGGFAAVGGPRNVNLGGLSATVTWNSGGFVPTNSSLVLSNGAADSTVTFQNPINFAGATQTIQVDRGSATVDAVLGGVLSNGGLTKSGTGILSLAVANTYSGGTTVSAGTLRVAANVSSGSAGPLGNTSSAVLLGDANTTANNSSPSLLVGGAFNVGLPVMVQNQATAGVYTIGGNTANSSTFSGLITLNQPATLN
jgi:fibronectin-binding autotransporter adhesin